MLYMDDNDALNSLDATGELQEHIKSRKWTVVAGLCDKKRKKETNDGLQVADPRHS